jgi:hypothetical protein
VPTSVTWNAVSLDIIISELISEFSLSSWLTVGDTLVA